MAASRLGSWVLLLLCFILAGSVSAGQTTTQAAASDPQAVILAEKAMAALTGGVAIADVTLAGTATRTAGSEIEEGSITLRPKAPLKAGSTLARQAAPVRRFAPRRVVNPKARGLQSMASRTPWPDRTA